LGWSEHGQVVDLDPGNNVPVPASSKRPVLRFRGVRECPALVPEKPDSSSVSGIAAQFTATNGCSEFAPCVVDSTREELLPNRLAKQEHRRLRRLCDATRELQRLGDRRAAPTIF